jgi:isocitrate/isopropylmalate dehydrogenase
MEAISSSLLREFILSIPTLVVLEGDQTGQELLLEALRVLDPSVTGVELTFERFDLSLSNRRATANRVVLDAAAAIKRRHLGLKAATITPEGQGDVGSPNRILREAIGGSVIVRTGRKLPRVRPVGGIHAPISVVRMAVGDAYGAKEWREGEGMDEVAFRTEQISRRVCRYVSEYAFVHASKMGATVFGGPKFTVSPVYEGMLKEEMDAAAERHPDIPYDPQLIDATYALLLSAAGDKPLVIPSLNRDGDCLSDLVMQLFGSIAGAESILLAFGENLEPSAVMAEAPHGTAPRLEGKNVANPLAMILAGAAVLSYVDDPLARLASESIHAAALDTVAAGIATADLGGSATTTEFTDAVILRLRSG